MLKLGIIAFIVGILLIVVLVRLSFDKKILKNLGIAFGFVLIVYGIIQIIQPSDHSYIKETQTTTPYKDHK